MANLDTNRPIKFNARFNWNENKPEKGGITLVGSTGFPNTKITITAKYYDPDSNEDTKKDDGFEYNSSNEQTIILT